LANVETIEFLKGPASVLYGALGSLGGIANTVTKAPLQEARRELSSSVNEFGAVRTTIDLGGPLAGQGKLAYRFNGALDRNAGFRDFSDEGVSGMAAPAFSYRLGEKASLLVRGEYVRREYRTDPYLPFAPEAMSLPLEQYYGEPSMPNIKAEGYTAQSEFEYKASSKIRLRQGLSAIGGHLQEWTMGLGDADPNGLVTRYPGRASEGSHDLSSQTELYADFDTGSVRHRTLLGLELSRQTYSVTFSINDSVGPVEFGHPTYGQTVVYRDEWIDARHPSDQVGVYAQDLARLTSRVTLLGGARFDHNATDQFIFQDDVAKIRTSHVSPRVGMIVDATPSTSAYGSYSQSFWPNLSCPSCGDPPSFPPELGEQLEVGLKQEALKGQVSATASVYQLTKDNVLEAIPGDPLGKSANSGRQRSKGFELDIQGDISDGVRLQGNYAYTDATLLESADPMFIEGERLALVPKQSGSLWLNVTRKRGSLAGAELGAGFTYMSKREASFPNTFELPAASRLDARLGYGRGPVRCQINVRNVTDERDYSSATAFNLALVPMEPRTVQGAIWFLF
jgi:iron complex outermembrane receptor protein